MARWNGGVLTGARAAGGGGTADVWLGGAGLRRRPGGAGGWEGSHWGRCFRGEGKTRNQMRRDVQKTWNKDGKVREMNRKDKGKRKTMLGKNTHFHCIQLWILHQEKSRSEIMKLKKKNIYIHQNVV